MSDEGLRQSLQKMRDDGAPDVAVRVFEDSYRRLVGGETGMLAESDIEPVTEIAALGDLPEVDEEGRRALERAIVLKLNGGLGTSMGLDRPKSIIEVKQGLSFLDIIARQVVGLRERFGVRLPLVLMNSFATREESLAALERHAGLESDVPIDFLQGRVPRIRSDDLTPVSWPDDPEREWAPPGHGDLYTSLVTSGMLATLLEHGYEYAFLSNSDNLGAVLEPRILAWMAAEEIPFVMEVARRTESDRKGGHLAQRPDGRYVLRETAQTPEEDLESLQDTERHRFVNTNNLWLDLRALDRVMRERDGVLGLPMIVNRKAVDPADPSSPGVIQLETAMGAAIGVFEGARPLHVPRTRFSPVKTTNDLLALRSDAYVLTDRAHVELAPERDEVPPVVDLDDDYFKRLADFEARIAPDAPPSLIACERIAVVGDVAFGRDVVVRGSVRIEQEGSEQMRIEDGSVLEG